MKNWLMSFMMFTLLFSFFSIVSIQADMYSVYADPTPSVPEVLLPYVFCFRITDIREVKSTTGMPTNNFLFEFEVLNWSNLPVDGMEISVGMPSSGITITRNAVDQDGRPLIPIDVNGDGAIDSSDMEDDNHNELLDFTVTQTEDKNNNMRLDNDPLVNPLPTDNRWIPNAISNTKVVWTAPAGQSIPPIDLLSATSTAAANAMIPGFSAGTTQITNGIVTPHHRIDDGNNALDGFVIELEDFKIGDRIALNWFLTNNGVPLGTVGSGNPYGFGVINLARLADLNSNPKPSAIFSTNIGFTQSPVDFFDNSFIVPDPAFFTVEFGAGLTTKFVNPEDAFFNNFQIQAPVNAKLATSVQNSNMTLQYDMKTSDGVLLEVSFNEEAKSLKIPYSSQSAGIISLNLSRSLIDARTVDEQDDGFFVFIDEEEVPYEETLSMGETRNIEFEIKAGEHTIEIIGTSVVPEFGSIVILILIVVMGSMIFMVKKGNQRLISKF